MCVCMAFLAKANISEISMSAFYPQINEIQVNNSLTGFKYRQKNNYTRNMQIFL